MRMPGLALVIYALSATSLAAEERGRSLGYCDSDIRQGWHFYCDRAPEPEEAPEEEMPVAAPPPASAAPAPTATERMAALSASLEELKARAILEPTPANVEAYMGAQMVATRMAGAFAALWQQVLFSNPHLDRNVSNPVSSLGGEVYQEALRADREAALKEAAAGQGLIFIFEAEARCPVCALQSRILATISGRFGISVLPVSVDGSRMAEYPAPQVDDGRLAKLGLAEFPRPVLALVDPRSNRVTVIGSGLLTEDMLLERVHALTRTTPDTRYAEGPFVDRMGTAAARAEAYGAYERQLSDMMQGAMQ